MRFFILTRGWQKCIGSLALTLLIAGCQFGNKDIHFTEEIQLASGEIVTAERLIKTTPLGEVGGPGGWESKYQSFQVSALNQANMPPKWESTDGLIPILLDRDQASNEWVLLATFYTCTAWYKLGRPTLPYAEFRVRDGRWQRLELSTQWFERPANVFADISSGGEPKSLTLIDKKKRADSRVAPEYRFIVSTWKTSC